MSLLKYMAVYLDKPGEDLTQVETVKEAYEILKNLNNGSIYFLGCRWIKYTYGDKSNSYIDPNELNKYVSPNNGDAFWINQSKLPNQTKGDVAFYYYEQLICRLHTNPRDEQAITEFNEKFNGGHVSSDQWDSKYTYPIIEVLTDIDFFQKYCQ